MPAAAVETRLEPEPSGSDPHPASRKRHHQRPVGGSLVTNRMSVM